MRWFIRRLGFYAFAIWVALTLTFAQNIYGIDLFEISAPK